MTYDLTLISHALCPYVQRAAIALQEKSVPFERIVVDLSNKPAWFVALSPLGKVPLLQVRQAGRTDTLFESAVILEYVEDTQPSPLHPADALERARHRGWIEFGSQILNRIAALYNASDDTALDAESARLGGMFERLETELGDGPWFAGDRFSLVDAVYGPIFRYYDVLDRIPEAGLRADLPRLAAWRARLAARTSVVNAVSADYPALLTDFLHRRNSALSRRLAAADMVSVQAPEATHP